MQRSSPSLLALRAVDALKVYLPFMLVQDGIAARLPEAWRWGWYALVVYYTATRVHLILSDWLTVRYALTRDGLIWRRGWPASVTTRAAWSEIGALHVEQDLTHQLLRRFRVRAVIGAEGREEIELDALDAAVVARLRELHGAAHGGSPTGEGSERTQGEFDADAPATPRPQVLFRAGLRDYLLISVGYGQFVLLIPFILGTWSDVAGMLGLPDGTALLDEAVHGGALILLAFVPVAAVFGVLRAWVSYRGYRVTRDATGFEASGGLLRRDVRRARLDEVTGVRVTRNPLLALVNSYSVSLVLASARGEFRSLVVLPVASATQVRQLTGDLVPGVARNRLPATRLAASVLLTIGVLGGAVTATALLAGMGWVAGALGLAALALVNACWIRWEAPLGDGRVVRHRSGLLWSRDYLLDSAAVRQVESWRLVTGTRRRPVSARLRVMDRRPVSLWLIAVPECLVDQLDDRVLPLTPLTPSHPAGQDLPARSRALRLAGSVDRPKELA